MDDLDQDEHRPPFRGHPLIATLTGCAVLVILAVSIPRLNVTLPQMTLLLAGAGLGLFLWLVGLVVTIRRASIAWIGGSLAILIAVGLLAGLGSQLLGKMQVRGDTTSLAEVEPGPEGTLVFPRDAEARGPISRKFVAASRDDQQDKRNFDAEMAKLNIGPLNSPYELKEDPSVLAHCDAIGALKGSLTSWFQRRRTRLEGLQATIAAADLPEGFKDGMRMMLAPGDTPAQLDAMRAPQIELLDSTQALCALLAKHSWSNQGGYFGFGGAADRSAFESLSRRRHDAVSETARLLREGRERMLKGREIVQDALNGAVVVR